MSVEINCKVKNLHHKVLPSKELCSYLETEYKISNHLILQNKMINKCQKRIKNNVVELTDDEIDFFSCNKFINISRLTELIGKHCVRIKCNTCSKLPYPNLSENIL